MYDYVKPVFLLVVIVLAAGAIGGVMAANRGRMVAAWSILCALFPPLLLAIYLCEVEGKYRRCSHCNELIKWHETVCTYCRSGSRRNIHHHYDIGNDFYRLWLDLEPLEFTVLDVENLRLHYARTCEQWLERFEQNLGRVQEMFDEPFVRAWRLYLSGCVANFNIGALQLFQIVFSRHSNNGIPWTREHLTSSAGAL